MKNLTYISVEINSSAYAAEGRGYGYDYDYSTVGDSFPFLN